MLKRREFLTGLFTILPAAVCYQRIWRDIAKTEMPGELLLIIDGSGKLPFTYWWNGEVFERVNRLVGPRKHETIEEIESTLPKRIFIIGEPDPT